ncbi:MAG TPA: M20/M25/M40 family metallo-hydrolase [Pyrinomonadaceae bacterium]|nr:M20/M25/M40 family metallo-hydrolase [Pyrinomonadaceae bacterium]
MSKSDTRSTAVWRAFVALLVVFTFVNAPVMALQSQAVAPAPSASSAPAPSSAAALSEAERGASERVRVETLREVTEALSSKEMRGRGTGQPGGDLAAQYIADRFAKLGLKPGGENKTYFQTIKFREFQIAPETSFAVGEQPLKLRDDYIPIPPYTGGKDLSARLVFVGYGIVSSAMGRDDLKGVDLRGKLVVILDGPPKGISEEAWKKAQANQKILMSLLMGGAAGLVIAGAGSEQAPYAQTADYTTRRQIEPADAERYPPGFPPLFYVSDAGAEKLFAASGTTYAEAKRAADRGEFVSRDLKQTAKVKLSFTDAKVTGRNVVGVVEGSDPVLKEQAVVYTAHYDAFGADAAGRFYPGAADNALGVAEMIAIAEALVAARPRRSVIFLAVTGEEYGLFGAEHWVKNPTWKIKQVAANLNFDGMGTEVYGPLKQIVGFGAEHSELGALLQSVAAATGNRIIPDPMPEEKAFYRSDHYAFVKKGVPALFLMGTPEMDAKTIIARVKEYEEKDYHQPTDVVKPDWNWEGPRGLAQVGVVLGLRIANADAMPAWLASSPFNRERGTNKEPPPEP